MSIQEQTIQSKVLARIRKMLNLANDSGATEGERDNAMRAVHATLAKYNLSLGQVEASDAAANEARERLQKAFLGKPWAIQIAASIARMYFCRYYYSSVGGRNAGPSQKALHTFVGRHSNVVTAQEMSQFIVESVNREANRFKRQMGGTYADYRAFAQGATQRIRIRCYEIEQSSKKEDLEVKVDEPKVPGTALAIASLYKTEEDANNQYLQTLGVKFASGRSQSYAEGSSARLAGAVFGSKVSLNRQVT